MNFKKNLVRCHSSGLVSETFHALSPRYRTIPFHVPRYVLSGMLFVSSEALLGHCDIGVFRAWNFQVGQILRKDLSTSSRCFWLVLFSSAAQFFRVSEKLATKHNRTSSFFHSACLFDNCSDFLGNMQEVALRHPITPC